MKLVLFSFHITDAHVKRLEEMVGRPLIKCNVCFITTAANPYRNINDDEIPLWLQETIDEQVDLFNTVDLFDFTRCSEDFDFKSHFSKYDCIFIGGGNVFYLSYFMKKYRLYSVLSNLIKDNSIVYLGGSAGAVILARNIKPYEIIDDPKDVPEQINDGLDLIEFVPIVHWGNTKYYEKLMKVKDKYEDDGSLTVTIKDNEAIFVENGNIIKI